MCPQISPDAQGEASACRFKGLIHHDRQNKNSSYALLISLIATLDPTQPRSNCSGNSNSASLLWNSTHSTTPLATPAQWPHLSLVKKEDEWEGGFMRPSTWWVRCWLHRPFAWVGAPAPASCVTLASYRNLPLPQFPHL